MLSKGDPSDVGRRAVRGVAALGLREGAMRVLAFGGDVALYRLLLPETFGLVVPIAFLAGIIKQLSDLGLAASLLQRDEEPEERDLRTVFAVQGLLVMIAAILIFFAGPPILDALDEGSPNPWLIRLFAISVLLSAFRAVPAAMLERHLRYGRLAAADVSGTVWFYGAGIALAAVGAGPWALVTAHVGASIVPTALVAGLFPWKPVPTVDRARLRQSLGFGAKFQGQRLLLMLKDSLIPILGPAAFGRSATGLLSWADKLAQQPLMLTQLVARVSLPAFSRAQADLDTVRRGATLAIKWTCIFTFPLFAVIFSFADEIARLIYGDAWLPAVGVLYLLATNALLVPINGLVTPILNALGHSGKVLSIAAAWAAAAWGLAAILTAGGFGYAAVAIALAATQAAALICLAITSWKAARIDVLRPAILPAASAAGIGALGYFALRPLTANLLLLILLAGALLAAYAFLLLLIDGKTLRREGADALRIERGRTGWHSRGAAG